MRICWFDESRLGLVEGAVVKDVTAALAALPPIRYPYPKGDLLIRYLDVVRREIERIKANAESFELADVKLLSPVASTSKIIGVPVNFANHMAEAKQQTGVFKQYDGGVEDQGLFLKANSSLVGCGEGVAVRFPERQTHHEIELGVVIGRGGANIPVDDALSGVAGYAIALDMTLRGGEDRSFRKSPDSYSVLGPWLTTADEVGDPQNLAFELSVNGVVRQSANTRDMIMGIARQIAWASSFYTLYPGDVIMSGTSAGVGPVVPGDVMTCWIESVGAMSVRVS